MQYNVKAILDWKYDTNGDPMVDVWYFLMMFLQPSVCRSEASKNLPISSVQRKA